MNFIKKMCLFMLATAFMMVGTGGQEANAICAPVQTPYTIPNPTLNDVVINGATLTKEGYLSASVLIPEEYSDYIEIVFLSKDGKEARRAKVDSIINMKTVQQTVLGKDGKNYTVSMKLGDIVISARNLPMNITDFITFRDNYMAKLEARNYDPKNTGAISIAPEPGCRNQTLTSSAQPIGYINSMASFPGKVNVNQDGTITITLQTQPAYANAKIYLVVIDVDGKEVKRVAIDPKKPRITANDLALQPGNYSIIIELSSGEDTIKSVPVKWTVSNGSGAQSQGNTSGLGNGTFPGGVEVTQNGTIRIIIQKQSYSSSTKFYLVITDLYGKEVKRTRVYPSNPRVSLSSKSLVPGAYILQMEMVDGSDKVLRSSSVTWTIPQPQLSIPSGDEFPGTIIVNGDGTFTFTITTKSVNKNYDFFVVLLDVDGDEIQRFKFDPAKPITKTIKEMNIQTGGYYLVIEVVDPKTGSKATSNPKFTTYNETQDIIVLVDDQLQKYDQSPVNVDGRTMVPLRAIFEALGAKVEWDGATQTVTATKDDINISLTINSNEALVNGKKVTLDVPAQLINEKTMVPVRFVSEALGADVQWDNYSRSVIIKNKE
ncbi:stalk domain-containing protein [Paenibacillus mesophilus]|uniref:stalk domain-containing protein n=1 Tax=Paenibacillus mesophilus TaxID=2582849 RepID=UPI00192E69EA|nr:stalk domain-containing protein [Paenibacillus mesophilus]